MFKNFISTSRLLYQPCFLLLQSPRVGAPYPASSWVSSLRLSSPYCILTLFPPVAEPSCRSSIYSKQLGQLSETLLCIFYSYLLSSCCRALNIGAPYPASSWVSSLRLCIFYSNLVSSCCRALMSELHIQQAVGSAHWDSPLYLQLPLLLWAYHQCLHGQVWHPKIFTLHLYY
jgi:hypothetical protein